MKLGFLVLDEGEPYDDMVQHRRTYLITYHQSTLPLTVVLNYFNTGFSHLSIGRVLREVLVMESEYRLFTCWLHGIHMQVF